MTPGFAALLSLAVALLGSALRWMTLRAALAAAVVGTLILTFGGWPGAVLLGLLFLSGSLLTFALPPARDGSGSEGPRTASQILANGTWAALGAAAIPQIEFFGWAVLAGALASAQADTWATEIGIRSPHTPRLITSWRPVHRGTSGAVTVAGSIGGIAGAGTMALAALLLARHVSAPWVFIGGIGGMVTDSLLGATVQVRYQCRSCGVGSETPGLHCGEERTRIHGLRLIDNDVVNLLATGCGGLVAAVGASLG